MMPMLRVQAGRTAVRRRQRKWKSALRGGLGGIAGRAALAALLMAPFAASGAERGTVAGLFFPVAAPLDQSAVLSATDPVARDATLPGPDTAEELRARAVTVDMARLAAARAELAAGRAAQLRLNFFEDVELDAVIERSADARYGWSLSGGIQGDPHGSVTLVVHGDILAGEVYSREGAFVIVSRNGAVHTIREKPRDFRCGVDGQPHDVPFAGTLGSVSAAAADGDDGSEVDVLVLFTEAALEVEGGLQRMRASVDLAVAWANDSYEASGVDLRLNLVAAVQVDYRESRKYGNAGLSNQDDDLIRLLARTDGSLDAVHTLRDRYAADVVNLIVDQVGGGGIAGLLNPGADDPGGGAFLVTNAGSEAALFAHEMGHVMGLRHDRYTEATFGGYRGDDYPLPPYAHGYVNQRAFEPGASEDSRWHTIMAYRWQCVDEGFFCRQLPRFSSPRQKFPANVGDPLGVSGEQPTDAVDGPADAVRTLNEHRGLVAGFRESATRCAYRLSEERREVSASGGGFSVDVDAGSSCDWTAQAFGGFLSVDGEAKGSGSGRVSFRVDANEGPARVGYVVVAGETLSIYQSAAIAPASVCARTPPVRDAIVSATGRDCGAISEFDLLEVTSLNLQYELRREGITTLDAGDFTGLGSLTTLRLAGNGLATIPDGAFDDLVGLRVLELWGNALTSVPAGLRALSSLQTLHLGSNRLETVPHDAFAGLSELVELHLNDNRLAMLPDGVFADLRNLWYLNLSSNRIGSIRNESLRGLWDVGTLILSWNPLGRLPEDLFEGILRVWTVRLEGTELTALPPQVFSHAGHVTLDLSDNRLADLSGVVFPGSNIADLDLANNALQTLPAGVFGEFYSAACRQRAMNLDLSGNPGTPFPLNLELDRVDGGNAATGPASVVVRVREGAPWPITARVVSEDTPALATEATVLNGNAKSEPFEVSGDAPTRLRFEAAPRIPGSYKGLRIALGEPLRLFALDDLELEVGTETHTLDLAAAFARPDTTWTFSATSADPGVATVTIVDGLLAIALTGTGATTVTVTATTPDGERLTRSFTVTVRPPAEVERGTWHGWRLELLRQLEQEGTDAEP